MTVAVPPLLLIAEGRPARPRRAPKIRPREIKLHMTVANTLAKTARSDWRWTHFPAGEARSVITGARLKRMGLKRGWPDFVLVSPRGLFHALELKRLREPLTEDQAAFHDWCACNGIPRAVCDTHDQAVAALTAWNALRITEARG